MRKYLLIVMFLSLVLTVKAQQNDKPASAQPVQSQDDKQDSKPEPAGGVNVFNTYMKKYTNHQYNNAQNGSVTLSFTVEKDGTLSGYKIVQSLNKEADDLTIDVLKDYNKKWKPAMQGGQPVSATYTIVVQFGGR